jgi:hypothetical protein
MAIYRLIANGSFGPAEVKAMTAAYEAALLDLGVADRDDPMYGPAVRCKSLCRTGGERSCINVFGL